MRSVITLLILAALAYGGWQAVEHAEREYPEHLPWTPLSLDDPVGRATELKIANLAGDRPACLALFEESSLEVTPLEEQQFTPNCALVEPVALERMTAAYSPGTVRLSCPLAASLAVWERQVVQPAARRLLGTGVERIEHLGTYSCRRLYGRSSGGWSKHATAEAIDIAGFRLEDGRSVSLLGDWGSEGPEGAFLRVIRNRGCDVFGTLLGPDYNAAHRDHFHLQAAGFGTCR
ncbi:MULTISPECIES: extensin-like domain-containing protein [Pacificimonas]|uniref:Extensin family protein n=1 Tax=Pacificimonas aurantium TaxID=1250540 RepID=A0ABS7WJ86_9SPHN|nr:MULTISPECIES: extensin family protein [Pacificimonas]MBZ6378459.1 extensin family protein [Pacificimonas aurantium]